MAFIVVDMLDGFVTATTFKIFDIFTPDKALEEERRYNNAVLALEHERLEWDKKQDLLRFELEKAQREKSEARESKIQTRMRLNNRPKLEFQPSRTFRNSIHSSVLLTIGVGMGVIIYKICNNKERHE